ncbi:MAG: formylglycine-generating enzyme family protein [Bacteroidales bacterium]|nr:formylglycine-generating enzyme family protein [Bacteroidales bacterium]
MSLLAVSLAFGFQSCKKDKDDPQTSTTENTTGGNGGQNNGDNTTPTPNPPTFSFSESYNSADKTVEKGAELKLTIGNLTAESVVFAFLDGDLINVKDGVITLPTTTAGDHKVCVVVDNEEKEFAFKVLLTALEIKTCTLSTAETELEVNTELKLNLDANNPCTITVKVNDNVIEAKNGVYVLPTDRGGEFAVSVEFNDGQNDVQAKELSYKVTKQSIESEEITVNSVTFKMNKVYGGTFLMGAQKTESESSNYEEEADDKESPVHEVTLSSYSIGQTEVTQALWYAVMGTNPSNFKENNADNTVNNNSLLPVEKVSRNDIYTFLKKLNEITGKTFRLPTEAEWEFAARGGINSQGYKYSGSDEIEEVAWFNNVSGNKTHPVGTKLPNELGIYDMTGNVWEFTKDLYEQYNSSPASNPTGADFSLNYVSRGGAYNNDAKISRVSYRSLNPANHSSANIGFRLAL